MSGICALLRPSGLVSVWAAACSKGGSISVSAARSLRPHGCESALGRCQSAGGIPFRIPSRESKNESLFTIIQLLQAWHQECSSGRFDTRTELQSWTLLVSPSLPAQCWWTPEMQVLAQFNPEDAARDVVLSWWFYKCRCWRELIRGYILHDRPQLLCDLAGHIENISTWGALSSATHRLRWTPKPNTICTEQTSHYVSYNSVSKKHKAKPTYNNTTTAFLLSYNHFTTSFTPHIYTYLVSLQPSLLNRIKL